MTTTSVANVARYMASVTAASPPPTMPMRWPANSGPSQTAQYATPRFCSASSEGSPSVFAVAPVARIRLCAWSVFVGVVTVNGRIDRSTAEASSMMKRVLSRSACVRICVTRSGPAIPSGNPGKFSTVVVVSSCPPAA